jgi:hypothetical protein
MSRVTIYEYLATNVPADAYAIISEGNRSVPKPKSSKELSVALKKYVLTNGEEGLIALAQIHPDRELIESICTNCESKKQKDKKENFSNVSGDVSDELKEGIKTSQMLVIGGFILVGLAIIMTTKK